MAKAKATPALSLQERRRQNARENQKAFREQQSSKGMKNVTLWVTPEEYETLLQIKDRFGLPTIRDTVYTTIRTGLDVYAEGNVAAIRRNLPRD